MNFNYTNIALSGVAGCGKNTVSSIITKLLGRLDLPYKELAIADNLKKELIPSSKELYGIDPSNCSRREKDLISLLQTKTNLLKVKLWP